MSYQCLCCEQRDAGHRYACTRCIDTMRRWLRELEDYAVILVATLGPLREQPRVGSVGAAFGSTTPIRDDVAVLLDYRSGGGAAVHRLRDPRDMDDEPIRSLPGSIHGIAAWLREERDETHPSSWTLVGELRYLRGQVESCSFDQWVVELWGDLHELHSQARALAHDVPRPLGHCLTDGCDGVVFWTVNDEDQARCVECHRTYTGVDLIRLGVAEEVAG